MQASTSLFSSETASLPDPYYQEQNNTFEKRFVRLATLAARLFSVPEVLICFAKNDGEWTVANSHSESQKSKISHLLGNLVDYSAAGKIIIVPDLVSDPRFSNNLLLMNPPSPHFFAAAFFSATEDYSLGAVCLLDSQTRDLSEEETNILLDLAALTQEQAKIGQTAKSLAQSEANLKALLNNNLQSVILIDPAHNIVAFNNLADQTNQLVWGSKLQPGTSIYNFVHPHDLDSFNFNFNHALAGEIVRLEKNIIGRDGSDNWFEVSYSPVVTNGQVTNVCFGVVNINERKKALNSLYLLEQAVAASPAGIIITDTSQEDNPVIFVNKGFEQLTGYSSEETLGCNCRFLQGTDTDQPGLIELRKALSEGRGCQVKLRNYRKDGSLFWVELRLAPLHNKAGKLTHFVGIQTDVSAKVEAEETLRESEERFMAFMDHTPAAAFILDDLANLVFVNGAYLELFGMEGDVIGRNCSELFPLEVSQKHREHDRWVLENQKVLEQTETWIRSDGSIGYWLGYKFPMHDASGRRLVGGVGIDVTAHTQAEEALAKSEAQLRQSQKMEAVGQLAGRIAHDFNNLLTAITGYSELILANLNPDDLLYDDVNEIQRSADLAAALTQQLLAFSRQQLLQPTILHLEEVVTEMSRMLRRLIGENIELVTLSQEGLAQIKADRSQLGQVIVNLAVNARDAMPHGGKLIFELANVELTKDFIPSHVELLPGNYVRLAVSDTGEGMNETVRARLFEPFFTTKERGRGTGLGLSTVYGIVKQSGGHIEVYSEVGHGTTFKIYLPTISPLEPKANEFQKSETAHSLYSTGRETILLVEDEEGVRNLAARVLEQYNYTVLVARNGSEALDLCEQYPGEIHLLLTDMVMPRLSGPDLAKSLAVLRPTIKVLYMSGYTDHLVMHHPGLSQKASGSAFLHKPFTPRVLSQKVREVLES